MSESSSPDREQKKYRDEMKIYEVGDIQVAQLEDPLNEYAWIASTVSMTIQP